jgi:hypothetical protein
MGDCTGPEIPSGSYVLLYKLSRTFLPGDIVAYRDHGQTRLGRVEEEGAGNRDLLLRRNEGGPERFAAAEIIGKVVLNTRVGSRSETGPNVTVVGTVTDAATGRPIRGARVADNLYAVRPDRGPQEAWTDANGRFTLRTWFEEHTLVVSAPGYEQRLVTLKVSALKRTREIHLTISLAPVRSAAEKAPQTSERE